MEKIFKEKKVTIMGLGLHGGGVGVAKFFCEQGAEVLVTDLKTKEQLRESLNKLKKYKIRYTLGEHKEEDFINTDLVIKNPAVPTNSPYLKIAKENGVEVDSDVNLFFKLCKVPIVGVTGTKGKSTIATLIYELLKTKYRNAILAGNIGVSPLEFLDKIKKDSMVVLELSSFELEDLGESPHIAVINSIYPDHLDRYRTTEDYIEAKKLIFKYQTQNDILVLNHDDQIVRSFNNQTQSKVYFFSKKGKQNGCCLEGNKIFFNNELVCNISDFKLSGEHNVSNILAALTTAKTLGVTNGKIKKVARRFKGVASRQELVAIKKGVKYFNDTTATIPDATVAAIQSFSKRFLNSKIVLVVGGQDKKLEYKELAKEIKNKVDFLVLLPGTATEKIKRELEGFGGLPPQPTHRCGGLANVFKVGSMKEAVKTASKLAKKGDVVVLSPAASSFNIFKNEFDRGNQFIKEVKKLK